MKHFFTLLVLLAAAPQNADDGIAPVDADGKPLNLDFETGTLKDWTVTGAAFENQPIKGDTVSKRRGDMKSDHKGEYWIGGFEKGGDEPKGTLVSAPFKVTHPWAVFYVSGGAHEDTCVQIWSKADKAIIAKVSGDETENLKPVSVDLSSYMGKEIYIKLVDQNSGSWGH